MRVVNVGSMNVDHVYAVDHFVRPGETLDSDNYQVFAGGKGFNQSIALARAGVETRHVGMVGQDGTWLRDRLAAEGVDTTTVGVTRASTGHAIIQVLPSGENAIVLHGGANREIQSQHIAAALAGCGRGDCLLIQNETSAVTEAIQMCADRKMRAVFNPAPMTTEVRDYPLNAVDVFIVNQTEAGELTGETDPETVCRAMRRKFPRACGVLTLGAEGAVYFDSQGTLRQPAVATEAVDTTAAGDTFTGYFLAELLASGDPAQALLTGCRAAAMCVARPGAADSIPRRIELE